MGNIGDFDPQFKSLGKAVLTPQGETGRLAVEQDLFPGILLKDVIA